MNQKALRNGISENQYCAWDRNRTKNSCEGDSGGPLQVLSSGLNVAKVVGVISFGVSCGTALLSIYTRVASYVDWIESIVWPDGVIDIGQEALL